jgi:hypothetical protein
MVSANKFCAAKGLEFQLMTKTLPWRNSSHRLSARPPYYCTGAKWPVAIGRIGPYFVLIALN